MVRFLLLALLIGSPPSADAAPLDYLYRSGRAAGMGGTYLGFAEGGEALFLNPASLATRKKLTVDILSSDVGASSDAIFQAMDTSNLLSNMNPSTINQLMGKNIFVQDQNTFIISSQNYAIGIIQDNQFALHSRNRSLPNMEMQVQTTNGIQAGFGFTLGKARKKKKLDVRLGIAAKYLFKRGGYRSVPFSTVVNMDWSAVNQLIGGYGSGVGFDTGAEMIFRLNDRFKITGGLSLQDVGGTKFSSGGGDTIPQNLSMGFGVKYDLGPNSLLLGFDYQQMSTDTDWRKRVHLGFAWEMPVLALYAGMNQVSFTYGASFNLWFFKIYAYSTAEELATYAQQDTERRYFLRIATSINL
ncbi:hypothetical protein K2X30_11335 [bacterium]|nr:hypothetical protein [bacterium]